MRLFCISIFVLIAFSAHAAIEWDFAKSVKDKCSTDSMIMSDWNACMIQERRTTDKQLNILYTKLSSILKEPEKLKKAQLAWLRFRDASCDFASSGLAVGGNLYSFGQEACIIDLTKKRINDLENYIKWDGCGGCPPLKP